MRYCAESSAAIFQGRTDISRVQFPYCSLFNSVSKFRDNNLIGVLFLLHCI